MDNTSGRLSQSPTVTLLRAIFNRNRLIPFYPDWIAKTDQNNVGKLLFIETGFWLAVKRLRLVSKKQITQVVTAEQKRKAVLNMVLFFSSIVGINAFLEPFRFYRRTQEHMMLNVLMILLVVLLIPAIILLWKDRKIFKTLPIANNSKSVTNAIRKINIAFWILIVVNIVATSFFAALKASSLKTVPDESALEILSKSQETALDEGPKLMIDTLTIGPQGPSTIFTTVGFCILRIFLGCGLSVLVTFILLYLLIPTVHSGPIFLTYLGVAVFILIAWEIYIFRKYRTN